MVSREELEELFEYRDGTLYGKEVSWRRKASNSRCAGRPLGTQMSSGHLHLKFQDRGGNKHKFLVHRLIYLMHHGALPEMLDHIDRDPRNNRIENLRPASKSLNSQNRGAQSNSKWGMRGIYKDSLGGYVVHIKLDGVRHSLGRTKCLGEAWRMRKDGESRYWPDVGTDEGTATKGTG